jgi:hypothetical protein
MSRSGQPFIIDRWSRREAEAETETEAETEAETNADQLGG